MPAGTPELHGVILADQVQSLDWHARQAALFGRVPDSTVREVVALIGRLLY
jgi:mRNA-degrading endonuclease toxin of MazEF toxin-antitoxin module